MKPISGKRMAKVLASRGWTLVRTKGSHHRYLAPDGVTSVTVPVHGNKDMTHGTQRSLMKVAGLTDDDL